MADALRGTTLDSLGRPIASVVVRVYDAGTSNLSSIYSDEAMTTPITNDGASSPVTEADGSWGPYYAANGAYDIKYLLAGYSFDNTDTANVRIADLINKASTIPAAHTFTGIVVHQGAETHSGLEVFTGTPLFNPGVAGPGLDLGANAENQRIPGMTADKVWDGTALRDATATPAANKVPVSNASGNLNDWVSGGLGPIFEAYLSANQTGLSSGVETKVLCNTEVEDASNLYDNATNYRFTPNVAGVYLVVACVTATAATTMTEVDAYIKKNGTTKYPWRRKWLATPGAGAQYASEVTALIRMNGTTDYIELYGSVTGTGALAFYGGANGFTNFSAVKVSI